MTPLVSFVIMGRNDGYMGDYLYRLGTTLSFLGESAAAAGLAGELEAVVVDWGSERPLADELPLTQSGRAVTRFIAVPRPMIAERYGSPDRWHPSCAVNVGVRRARGRFVIFTDSDCLWTTSALETLGRLLRGEVALPARVEDVYCYVRRYQIPWATVQRKPRLGEWRRLAGLFAATMQPENPAATFLGGFSAGQLMHRDLWHHVRGYDETLDKAWGWSDNDLVFRVCQEHSFLDVSAYGFFGLHMEHWPHTGDRQARDQATVNPMLVRNAPVANGPDWGLGDVELPCTSSRPAHELPPGTGCSVALTGQTAAPVWRSGAEASDFVRRIKLAGDPSVPAAQLEAVAQVTLADRPVGVFWFGPLVPAVLETMIQASPGCELLLVNPWPEGASCDLPFHPGHLSGHIQRWGFKGWARIVQGDPQTALTRLAQSRNGDTPMELVWLDPATPESVWPQIAAQLAPGGVVLVPAADSVDVADRLGRAMPSCVIRVAGAANLVIATRPFSLAMDANMPGEPPPVQPIVQGEQESLRVVLDMLLKDKALALVEPESLTWHQPLLVVRSAHMGRMAAFFRQVTRQTATPDVHVLSHARDEAALRAMAPFPITVHAYTAEGPYRLDDAPAALLARLRGTRYGTVFFLDAGTRAHGLDEVERLVAAVQPEPIVCFMGNDTFAQAPDMRQRQLAKAAFLQLIEWYQFRLDPDAPAL